MKQVLAFLNLLDNQGNISITNVAAIVCVTKMAMASQLSGVDLGALLTVLGNYAHKRMVNGGSSEN